MKTKTNYGLWESNLLPTDASGQKRFLDLKARNNTLVWAESRGSASVIVAKTGNDAPNDVSTGVGVRGGVGYGGGEFDVFENIVAFSGANGRIYTVNLDHGKPVAISPPFGSTASPTFSPDGKHVAYVHTEDDVDVVAAVPTDGSAWPKIVAQGADFYNNPTWSPDGNSLTYVCWDKPNMPWDSSRLEQTTLDGERKVIFEQNAVAQPHYSPNGKRLAFVSDAEPASTAPEAGGRWQIFVQDSGGEIRQITNEEMDFGGPAWVQGIRYFDWIDDENLLAIATKNGQWNAFVVNVDACSSTKIEGLEKYAFLSQPVAFDDGFAFVASAPKITPRIVSISKTGSVTVIQRAAAERFSESQFAQMQPKSWTFEGIEVFGNYYAPTNDCFESDGLPPAIIMIHGGPTSQRSAAFSFQNQFFTSRGYAVLDVNYRGSTGYGREYMQALYGNWGVSDVDDAVSAADFLAKEKLADPKKIIIMGGSAGGYTVLQSLVNSDTFAAGVCLYGIGNLFTLAAGTHKFEASYNDIPLGALPEANDIYRDRSPLFHAEKIKSPLIIFHGRKDLAVPFEQAENLVKKLTSKHEFHIYDNEGHGWRNPETIEHFYNHTLSFLESHVIRP